MSPILKRDISETLRQARRLASATTGTPLDYEYDEPSYPKHDYHTSSSSFHHTDANSARDREHELERVFSSGADRRKGVGIENGDVGWIPTTHSHDSTLSHVHNGVWDAEDVEEDTKGKGRIYRNDNVNIDGRHHGEEEDSTADERDRMISTPDRSGFASPVGRGGIGAMEYEEAQGDVPLGGVKVGQWAMGPSQWRDLRSLLMGVSLLHHTKSYKTSLSHRTSMTLDSA